MALFCVLAAARRFFLVTVMPWSCTHAAVSGCPEPVAAAGSLVYAHLAVGSPVDGGPGDLARLLPVVEQPPALLVEEQPALQRPNRLSEGLLKPTSSSATLQTWPSVLMKYTPRPG